jgi:hypothetical protein
MVKKRDRVRLRNDITRAGRVTRMTRSSGRIAALVHWFSGDARHGSPRHTVELASNLVVLHRKGSRVRRSMAAR